MVETPEEIYRSQWDDLVRLAVVVSGDLDAAPDLVQDVFADFFRDHASIRNPAGWLRTAVVHRSRSWVRRGVTRRRYIERHGWEHGDRLGEDGTGIDLDVRRALARLSPDQRATVFLRYYLDLPVDEIASVLGCRTGTVKSRLNRAHARLEEELDDQS